MTDPERRHSSEPAEGDPPGDSTAGGRTPHPQDPAEGGEPGSDDAATPDA